MNATRVLAGFLSAAMAVGMVQPVMAEEEPVVLEAGAAEAAAGEAAVEEAVVEEIAVEEAVLQTDNDVVIADETYEEQIPAEEIPGEVYDLPADTVEFLGDDAEEFELEELLIMDEEDTEAAVEETEAEAEAEKRFAVMLPEAEGGEVLFAESETLPPEEENQDEAIREKRSFAEGGQVGIVVRTSDEYRLAEIRVVAAEDENREYPLETTEQGYVFLMPAESVKVQVSFEKIQMPESEEVIDAATEQDAGQQGDQEADMAADLPVGNAEQENASDLPADAVHYGETNAGVYEDKTSVDTKNDISAKSVQEKKEEAEDAEADKDLLEVAKPITGVKLNKSSLTLNKGKKATLTATVTPKLTVSTNVTWKSSNPSVATVNSKGVVTAKKPGTATITATTTRYNKKASCKVTVKSPVTKVKLNQTKVTITKGKSTNLKATVSPSDASNKKVTWKSSNTAVASVTQAGKVTAKKAGTAKITVTTADGKKTASCTVTVKNPAKKAAAKKTPSVSYRTHVQSYGWQAYVKNGAMSGTQGQAKRLEGINIKLSNTPYSGGITYRTHVQTYGWQGWKSNGAMSGTSGQAKRLEAIQIKLTGQMAKKYDVYYRVHAQSYGWLGWAKNGASAGTSGLAKRLEGIQIKLVKKGGSAPGSTVRPYVKGTNTTAKALQSKRNYETIYGPTLNRLQYQRVYGNIRYTAYDLCDVTNDGIKDLIVYDSNGYMTQATNLEVYSYNGRKVSRIGTIPFHNGSCRLAKNAIYVSFVGFWGISVRKYVYRNGRFEDTLLYITEDRFNASGYRVPASITEWHSAREMDMMSYDLSDRTKLRNA